MSPRCRQGIIPGIPCHWTTRPGRPPKGWRQVRRPAGFSQYRSLRGQATGDGMLLHILHHAQGISPPVSISVPYPPIVFMLAADIIVLQYRPMDQDGKLPFDRHTKHDAATQPMASHTAVMSGTRHASPISDMTAVFSYTHTIILSFLPILFPPQDVVTTVLWRRQNTV